MLHWYDLNPINHPIVAWLIGAIIVYYYNRWIYKKVNFGRNPIRRHVLVLILWAILTPVGVVVAVLNTFRESDILFDVDWWSKESKW